MRIDSYTPTAARGEGGRVTVVSMAALAAAADGSPAETAKTLEALRTIGGLTARVVEAKPDNRHVLDFSGTRITLKLAQSFAAGELVAVLIGTAADPQTDARRSEVLLSNTGRWLTEAITGEETEAPATSSSPLAEASPGDSAGYSKSVRQALRDTGIFYESHLATWIEGRGNLEEIRREPKARLGSELQPGAESSPELAGLVRRQLDALESRSIGWQGNLWPGQSGDITIREDSSSTGDGASANWSTRIRVNLPRLGAVEARIGLNGGRLQLSLAAGPQAAAEIARGKPELQALLAGRGMPAERFEVQAHE